MFPIGNKFNRNFSGMGNKLNSNIQTMGNKVHPKNNTNNLTSNSAEIYRNTSNTNDVHYIPTGLKQSNHKIKKSYLEKR